MSAAGAEWVRVPTDTYSAPVRASSGIWSSVTPPEISIFAPATAPAHSLSYLFDRHVVDQDAGHARIERRIDLGQALRLDLDRQVVIGGPHPLHRFGNASGKPDMVIFDENPIVESQPMIDTAPSAHGVLLEHAQGGRRLARVENGDGARR